MVPPTLLEQQSLLQENEINQGLGLGLGLGLGQGRGRGLLWMNLALDLAHILAHRHPLAVLAEDLTLDLLGTGLLAQVLTTQEEDHHTQDPRLLVEVVPADEGGLDHTHDHDLGLGLGRGPALLPVTAAAVGGHFHQQHVLVK